MDPRVSIIILNWNGEDDTIECLESLHQINKMNKEKIATIVVLYNPNKQVLSNIRSYANQVGKVIAIDNSEKTKK